MNHVFDLDAYEKEQAHLLETGQFQIRLCVSDAEIIVPITREQAKLLATIGTGSRFMLSATMETTDGDTVLEWIEQG